MMQTHVLYTGGTLGMVSTPNGLAPGADLTGWLNQLLSGTELAGTFETLSFEHLIDSANATPDDWRRIVDDLWEHRDDADSFVVLHGTDTLAYTSAALSYALTEFGKPVVVTAAPSTLGGVAPGAAPYVPGARRAAPRAGGRAETRQNRGGSCGSSSTTWTPVRAHARRHT